MDVAEFFSSGCVFEREGGDSGGVVVRVCGCGGEGCAAVFGEGLLLGEVGSETTGEIVGVEGGAFFGAGPGCGDGVLVVGLCAWGVSHCSVRFGFLECR